MAGQLGFLDYLEDDFLPVVGRPTKKNALHKQNLNVNVRLSKQDHVKLEKLQKQLNMNVSNLMRYLINSKYLEL